MARLLGADADADAGVPDDADTPVPSSSTSARLTDPSCVSHADGGGELTVGVTNPGEPEVTVDPSGVVDDVTDVVEQPSVTVQAEVLDAVSLEVELDDGVTALELSLPPECEVDEEDRSIISCLVGDLLPGTSATATLDLGLDGGGGATVTVKSGDTTIDVQALELIPGLSDVVDAVEGLVDEP